MWQNVQIPVNVFRTPYLASRIFGESVISARLVIPLTVLWKRGSMAVTLLLLEIHWWTYISYMHLQHRRCFATQRHNGVDCMNTYLTRGWEQLLSENHAIPLVTNVYWQDWGAAANSWRVCAWGVTMYTEVLPSTIKLRGDYKKCCITKFRISNRSQSEINLK